MDIKKATFIGSFVREDQCPTQDLPEYAFIGRSNVGKSSLINMLTNHKDLAKVSGTPGKTQTINYFKINDLWHLVDLPGYGYARVSQSKRSDWERMIHGFLRRRKQIQCTFVLIDAMIPPQRIDIAFMTWLTQQKLPFAILYTKTDRLTPLELKKNLAAIRQALTEIWEVLPNEFVTSAEKGVGKTDVLDFIAFLNQ